MLPAERGDILDRNGEPLADSVDGAMVVADPSLTTKKAPALAKFLATRLDVDYFKILPRLRGEGSRYEYIARQIPAAQADRGGRGRQGEELRRPLDRARPGARSTRADDVAANLIGFLGTPDPTKGRAAAGRLGRAFDKILSGTDGEATLPARRRQQDPARRQHHRAGGRRAGHHHHDRPRPAVVHPAGAPPDRRVGGRRPPATRS